MTTEYVRDDARMYVPRLHWPSIVAGSFVALSLFVLSVLLARACDVDITFRNAFTTGGEIGAIVWGGVAALICFSLGAMVSGRNAVSAGRTSGMLNGFMVWAVTVPILVYGLNSGIGPRLGQTAEFGNGMGVSNAAMYTPQNENGAVTASARLNGESAVNSSMEPTTTGSPNYISHPQAAAWWMICSLGLGLIGAAIFGKADAAANLR